MADFASPKKKNKDKTVAEIERLAKQRENRRKSAELFKRKRDNEIKKNEKKGMPGDVDFQRMIRRFRKFEMVPPSAHRDTGPLKINVVVRKRPVSESEIRRKDFDSVSCSNPRVYVHHCKLKVDGISKYLNNVSFELDHAFHESCSNEEVYNHTAKYLVEFSLKGGRATCFAYGQTGSGKTFTMGGVQALAAKDVFKLIRSPENVDKQLEVYCSFFELYGGRCMDLLHDRHECTIREDGKGRIHVEGLQEVVVSDEEELLECIERGSAVRTTHATEMNNDSSRSHAICQIAFRRLSAREGSEPYGKLSLIDLAGSERGQDTKHHNRQRRQESAEINKSLLALKECVRALDSGSAHVPYRASKLTMVLKDSFSPDARTVMISCISPVASSADHTLNTLRYADRVKEKVVRDIPDTNVKRIMDYNNDPSLEYDSEFSFGDNNVHEEEDIEDEESDGSIGGDRPPMPSAISNSRLRDGPRLTPAKAPTPAVTTVAAPSAQKPRRQAQSNESNITSTSSLSSHSSSHHDPQNAKRKPSASQNSSVVPPASTPIRSRLPQSGSSSSIARPQARKLWDDPSATPSAVKPSREPLQTFNNTNVEDGSRQRARAISNQQDDDEPVENANEEKVMNFQDVVRQLVDMEEELLSAHMKAIQKNADMLTEEGALLSKVQGSDVVDYDIEEYAARLDDIIDSKVKLFQDLQSVLRRFRKHLALEDVASSKMVGI